MHWIILTVSVRIYPVNVGIQQETWQSPKTEITVNTCTGLKVNNQLVAYATRFLAVRLKKCVVAPPRLKSRSIVRLL